MATVQTSVKYLSNQSPEDNTSNRITDRTLSFHERKLAYRLRNENSVDRRNITVQPIRGKEHQFSLQDQGFQLAPLHSKCTDFHDLATVEEIYYPEIVALLKKCTGAIHVQPYDRTVRYQTETEALAAPPDDTTVDIHGPSRIVHIDDTPRNAHRMVEEKLTPEQYARLKGRPFAIMNVWKPLKTVQRDPLALIDARSISPEDRLVQPLPAPDSFGGDWEVFMLKYSQNHRWWFQADQKEDEAFVFKIYDSNGQSQGESEFMGAAHVSIDVPGTEDSREAMESIEVRSLVFF